MRFDSLQDVLVGQLTDLYDAERQLMEALPKATRAATTPELKEALELHLGETRDHVERLDDVFRHLSISPRSEHCEAMEGLLREGDEVMAAEGDPIARDAALIGAAQRIEHYEIAGYGTARALADQLGLGEVRELLNETLEEESAADSTLTKIATGGIFSSGVNDVAAGSKRAVR